MTNSCKVESAGARIAEQSELADAAVLVVDDEPDVARALATILQCAGCSGVVVQSDARRAIDRWKTSHFDAILLDLHMPVLDGFEVMREMEEVRDPDDYAPILVITGEHSPIVRNRALASGAKDFIQKPFEPTEVVARLRNLVVTSRMHRRLRSFNAELARRVEERTAEAVEAKKEVLERLARAGEYRDDMTGLHAQRVGELAGLLAEELGLDEEQVDVIRKAAPLHDIGKIGVSDTVLLKQGSLTPEEIDHVRQHTIIGARILSGSSHELLRAAQRIALTHHEFWNGEGYPRGLEGDQIPIEGRIVAVADAFDSMTNDRPYRRATAHGLAMAEILRWRSRQFAPDVVDALCRLHERGVLATESPPQPRGGRRLGRTEDGRGDALDAHGGRRGDVAPVLSTGLAACAPTAGRKNQGFPGVRRPGPRPFALRTVLYRPMFRGVCRRAPRAGEDSMRRTYWPHFALLALLAVPFLAPAPAMAQVTYATAELHEYDARDFGIDPASVTFTKDIAPILQQSCQNCHRPDGGGPMSLINYNEVRRYASRIRQRTAIRDRMGTMPPWYVEKDIGIQHYQNDPSLSDEDLAKIQAWVDNGAPEGDPADMPEPLDWGDGGWTIRPDLIVSTEDITVEGDAPDWWGEITSVPTGLEEDRYVKAVQVREVNDVPPAGSDRATVGGKYIVHHMIWRTQVPGTAKATFWPVHEVGRNPDVFAEGAGRLLHAGSEVTSESIHLHSNGRTTTGHLEIAFEFFPKDYEPIYQGSITSLANGSDIDIRAGEDGQVLDAYTVVQRPTKIVSFEPHLHAPGERMCLEMVWGFKAETLSCVGYDHNWVRTYVFEPDYQPLIPPGAVLHIRGFMNNSETNPNIPDPRNWQGSGNRSVANMFIDLGERVSMSEEQFVKEVQERVEKFDLTKNDYMIGCPLCLAVVQTPGATPTEVQAGGQQD